MYMALPIAPVMISEAGKASHVYASPIFDNNQKMGMRQKTWRVIAKMELCLLAPMAWKNVGDSMESTAG